jgi:hypothetical protein
MTESTFLVDRADKCRPFFDEITQGLAPHHHATVVYAPVCESPQLVREEWCAFEDEEQCSFQMKNIPPKTPRPVTQMARMISMGSLSCCVPAIV